MDVVNMRKQLVNAYPLSTTWPRRVEKLSDSQVVAIWTRLKSKGQIKNLGE